MKKIENIQDAYALKCIELFAQQHTTCNGWTSPAQYTPTPEFEEKHWDPTQIANDWQGARIPDDLEIDVKIIESIDDGASHDKSTINLFCYNSPSIGRVLIYSYNNNAWGHCDVLIGQDATDTPDIATWLNDWASNCIDTMEQWMLDYIDYPPPSI